MDLDWGARQQQDAAGEWMKSFSPLAQPCCPWWDCSGVLRPYVLLHSAHPRLDLSLGHGPVCCVKFTVTYWVLRHSSLDQQASSNTWRTLEVHSHPASHHHQSPHFPSQALNTGLLLVTSHSLDKASVFCIRPVWLIWKQQEFIKLCCF